MTSKSLLCNICKEDVKRRLWIIAIAFLSFLFFLPVYLLMNVERVKKYAGMTDKTIRKQNILDAAEHVLGIQNYVVIGVTIILAVLCAISGFAYLQSKRKVDFYHSIPVKRETFFVSSYLVGIAIYVIPYVLTLCISFLLAKGNGFFNTDIWNAAWKAFGINLLNYIITFSVVVIAILLTGQLIVSMLATAVFFSYGPALAGIYCFMADEFFNTYYYKSSAGFIKVLTDCSPIGAYVNMIGENIRGTSKLSTVLLYIGMAFLLTALALVLYKNRKSESAGKAIAYKQIQPFVKVLVSIPVGLIVGMMFSQFTDNDSILWYIFGMICGYLLCSVIMEIIYHFDFKAALKGKLSLLIGGISMFVIFSIFKFDLLHYDSYVPEKSSIESMAIVLPYLDTDANRYGIVSEDNNRRYYDVTDLADEFMYIKDIDIAYEIGKKAARDGLTPTEKYYENGQYESFTTLNVIYRLKSGRKVYRKYNINEKEFYEDLDKVYQTREYKEGTFEIYHINTYDSVECVNEFDSVKMSLSKEECEQLKTLYQDELSELSLKDLEKEAPIAELRVMCNSYRYNLKIYPSYTKTIQFLTEHGFDFTKTYDMNEIELMDVDYMIPYDQQDNKEYRDYLSKNPEWDYSFNVNYKDKDKISELLPYLVRRDYSWHNGLFNSFDTNLVVTIRVTKDEYGNKEDQEYVMRPKDVPEWLKKDIMYYEK